MDVANRDIHWMKRAVALAYRGLGLTSPNPCVGAVIIHHDQIIGEGFHEQAGLPHAEINAINDATARGYAELFHKATLYVTLEPCSTTGKTPPCTDAIVKCRFKRVVYGSEDPNPAHRGAAARIFDQAGILIDHGILKEECERLIRSFRLNMQQKRPWVIAKSAMSLDGRISRSPERSQWLTNEHSRSFVHSLRAECDAIITGGNTVRLDNPALTIRHPDRTISPAKEQPWRIVLTKNACSIPRNSACLTDEFQNRTLIVENVSNYLELLQNLYLKKKVAIVLLESGGTLMREFLQAELVDEWVGFYAPFITGGGIPGIAGEKFLEREAYLAHPAMTQFGEDLCIRGDVHYR